MFYLDIERLTFRYESESAGSACPVKRHPVLHRRAAQRGGMLGIQYPGAGSSYSQEVPESETFLCVKLVLMGKVLMVIVCVCAGRSHTWGWRSSLLLACVSSWTAQRPRCARGCRWSRLITTHPTPTTTQHTPQTSCTPQPTSCARTESR